MLSRRQFLSAALGVSAVAIAGPSLTHAQTAPADASVDPTLFDYLSLTPSSIANLSQVIPLTAGNQQLQAEALAFALPFDMNNDDQMHEWIQGTWNVTLPSFIQTNVMRDDFVANTGFDVSQIHSGAEAGEPPSMVTFLRGSFDPAAVQAVQVLNGYTPVDIAGHTVYSLYEDAEIDLTNPISAMALARMNNSTILDDGTLVYAATLDLIEQVLTPGPTLLEQPGIQQALATLDAPLISSLVLGPGGFLPGIPLEIFEPNSNEEIAAAMESLRDQTPAPIVLSAIAGDTPGGPIEFETRDAASVASQPESLSTFALVYGSPEDAQLAATQIDERLSTGSSIFNGRPWTDMFQFWTVTPNIEQSSVLLSIKWNGRAGRAFQLVANRDIGFITG